MIGKANDTGQRRGLVEIGKQRYGPGFAPASGLVRVAQQREHAIAPAQARQGSPGDITATNDQ